MPHCWSVATHERSYIQIVSISTQLITPTMLAGLRISIQQPSGSLINARPFILPVQVHYTLKHFIPDMVLIALHLHLASSQTPPQAFQTAHMLCTHQAPLCQCVLQQTAKHLLLHAWINYIISGPYQTPLVLSCHCGTESLGHPQSPSCQG